MEEVENNAPSESETVGANDEAVNINLLGAQTGVLGNALKLMNGKYGGAFYVRYICDIGRGYGWLQLLIEYPTGMIKTQLLCKNVCKVSSLDEDGLGEVEGMCYERYQSGEHIVFKPRVRDSLRSGLYDIMRVYERPDMPIPLLILWERIIQNYAEIPVLELSIKPSLQDIYRALIERAEDIMEEDIRRMGKGYVLLTKEEVEEVASELGSSLQEVRTEFAVRGLWVTDKNSGSFQKTRKIDKKNCRFYALRTELPSGKIAECKEVENVDYIEKVFQTREEAEIAELRFKVDKAEKEKHELAQIVCERVPDLTQEEIFSKLL